MTNSEEEKAEFTDAHPEMLRNYLREEAKMKGEQGVLKDDLKAKKDAMVDNTGINKKALGWLGQLDRAKPENRQDIIRSLKKGIDDMEGVWAQGETEDMLEGEAA